MKDLIKMRGKLGAWPWAEIGVCAAVGFAVFASAALATESTGKASADAGEAAGVIFERQQIMLQLEKDTETLGKIVAGEVPADQLAATTRAIADGAKDSVDAFKAQVAGGRAKPEVWSNWADYSARLESFAKNADSMAKIGETGNVTAVTSMMGEALPCKQCHDVYREKKK